MCMLTPVSSRQWAIKFWLPGLLALLVLLPGRAQAQPTWQAALAVGVTNPNYTNLIQATTIDANGDVFVTGSFNGQVVFGSTTLTSAGNQDVFVAKWSPATQRWVWAASGGGTGDDRGVDLAVSGTNFYVTGTFTNTTTNATNVLFGGQPLNGMGTNTTYDVFVVKYTDNGSSGSFGWATAGGGQNYDYAQGIAASGNSVYITGTFANNSSNSQNVKFGGQVLNGVVSFGSSEDVYVVKYTDTGTAPTLAWATAGGGQDGDDGFDVVVRGNGVYVAGSFTNSSSNVNNTRFGGQVLNGLSSTVSVDAFVVKYLDAGTSVSLGWAVAGGGTGTDAGRALALSGAAVYVTGYFTNTSSNANNVRFGGQVLNGMASTASNDAFVAKYTEAGTTASYNWAVAGGGNSFDYGTSLAVNGTSIYVAGVFFNDAANSSNVSFGGQVLKGIGNIGVAADQFVARYNDLGATAGFGGAIAGGSAGTDDGITLAGRGTSLYVGGAVGLPATFGNLTLPSNNPPSGSPQNGFLARIADSALLATTVPAGAAVRVYPNPSRGWLVVQRPAGTLATEAEVVNALGQVVRRVALATPEAQLGVAGLPAGVYALCFLLDGQHVTQRFVLE